MTDGDNAADDEDAHSNGANLFHGNPATIRFTHIRCGTRITRRTPAERECKARFIFIQMITLAALELCDICLDIVVRLIAASALMTNCPFGTSMAAFAAMGGRS